MIREISLNDLSKVLRDKVDEEGRTHDVKFLWILKLYFNNGRDPEYYKWGGRYYSPEESYIRYAERKSDAKTFIEKKQAEQVARNVLNNDKDVVHIEIFEKEMLVAEIKEDLVEYVVREKK